MDSSLWPPFHSLPSDNYLARGANAHVFRISANIAFKYPTSETENTAEICSRIESEKVVYRVLMDRPHPYILQAICCVPEGIFLRRMQCTLRERLAQPKTAIPTQTQELWVWQMASAVAWLETLGFVHGDLRIANMLLDDDDNLQVADFDATVRAGDRLQVGSVPLEKLGNTHQQPVAGPVTEQFSLASCMYSVRFGGQDPWRDVKSARMRNMVRDQLTFPSVAADPLLGEVMTRCWSGEYDSMAAVKQDVLARLGWTATKTETMHWEAMEKRAAVPLDMLRQECEEFLAQEKRGMVPGGSACPGGASVKHQGSREQGMGDSQGRERC